MSTIEGYGITVDPTAPTSLFSGGTTVSVNASATVDDTSGVPAVTVTNKGDKVNANFNFGFTGLKGKDGENGKDGKDGTADDVEMKVTIDSTTGTPSAAVSKTVVNKVDTFNVAMSGIKGEKGDKGANGIDGANGKDGTNGVTPNIIITPTVDSNVGTPSVDTVKTISGNDSNFAINFHNLKGEKGADGAQGTPGVNGTNGAKGSDGVTPSISVSASVDDTMGTPSVVVNKTGTDAAPNFDLAFSGLKASDNLTATAQVLPRLSINSDPNGIDVTTEKTYSYGNPNINFGFCGLRGSLITCINETVTEKDNSSITLTYSIVNYMYLYFIQLSKIINSSGSVTTNKCTFNMKQFTGYLMPFNTFPPDTFDYLNVPLYFTVNEKLGSTEYNGLAPYIKHNDIDDELPITVPAGISTGCTYMDSCTLFAFGNKLPNSVILTT